MTVMNHPNAVTLINCVDLLADRDGKLRFLKYLFLTEHVHDNRLEIHEAEEQMQFQHRRALRATAY